MRQYRARVPYWVGLIPGYSRPAFSAAVDLAAYPAGSIIHRFVDDSEGGTAGNTCHWGAGLGSHLTESLLATGIGSSTSSIARTTAPRSYPVFGGRSDRAVRGPSRRISPGRACQRNQCHVGNFTKSQPSGANRLIYGRRAKSTATDTISLKANDFVEQCAGAGRMSIWRFLADVCATKNFAPTDLTADRPSVQHLRRPR